MLELFFYPDSRLSRTSSPVKIIDDELILYCRQMVETMHKENGIGLAGVQTGNMRNFFVVHVPDDRVRICINPEIISFSDTLVAYEEGCLSIPGVYADVQRPNSVQLRAWNEDGREFNLEAEGLLARVIQHEYDHLQGKLFFEYLRPHRQRRLIHAYNRIYENTLRRNS